MSWLRWEKGRQESGYWKLLLARSKLLKFDVYILKLPTGCHVPAHRDEVPGFRHFRLNVTLRKAREGGFTLIQPAPRILYGIQEERAYVFRPDLYTHMVTEVKEGSVWLLSIGWLRKERENAA